MKGSSGQWPPSCQTIAHASGPTGGLGHFAVATFLAFSMALLLSSCRTGPSPAMAGGNVPTELRQQAYLFEVVRYLYRWHLDEPEIEQLEKQPQLVVWVRHLEPRLDPGDHSQEAELILPQVQISAKVKKEDYSIEELGVADKSPDFRITRVTADQARRKRPRDCVVVKVDMQDLRDYLFQTRDQHNYADQALVDHLRQALHKEASTRGVLASNVVTGEQTVYLAPLSPVSNDTWAFWEDGRKVFYIASDMDLSTPAVWEHEALTIHIYDLDDQVVGSHEEAPASNRFLTREEASRVLFNCVVLGQRLTVNF